jgi:hypothetical protein
LETQQTLYFETISAVDVKASRSIFEQLMNETLDNVFSSMGTVCRQAIYDRLEREYGIRRNEVVDHIEEFSEALAEIFGGAIALLEIQIMKRLCQKVPQFKYRPEGNLTFPDYVNALSRFIETR